MGKRNIHLALGAFRRKHIVDSCETACVSKVLNALPERLHFAENGGLPITATLLLPLNSTFLLELLFKSLRTLSRTLVAEDESASA